VRLLELEIATLWVTNERGRLVRTRTIEDRPHPLLVVAAGAEGMVWSCAASVPDDLADDIQEILTTVELDDVGRIGWEPDCREQLLRRLATIGPMGGEWRGPCYLIDDVPPIPGKVAWCAGGDAERDSLTGLMPEGDREGLGSPWAVAMVDDRVVAVCETSRSAPSSVEAGVWTYERYQRRGLGSAVVAAWASLVTDRTAFYSTSHDNRPSQAIARRLGFRPIGQMWHVSETPDTRV
jgi:hypothetical protein